MRSIKKIYAAYLLDVSKNYKARKNIYIARVSSVKVRVYRCNGQYAVRIELGKQQV